MFLDHSNMALALDLYELTMAAAYYENKQFHQATFELFVRKYPANRSFLLTAGLEQAIDYLENLRFKGLYLDYLRNHPYFSGVSGAFFDYLEKFHFTGDVWAVPEGTVLFANEPFLQVTAPLIEAQLVETYLLSTINFQTLIASKAARVVLAAKGKAIVEFGARRAHGPQAAVLAARAAFIGGCVGTSNVLAGYLLGIPIYGTIAHSYVLNFESEIEAFESYSKVFPNNNILLIDTYNTLQGAKNAVSLGFAPGGVRLDSGDMLKLSLKVRKILNDAGCRGAKIIASGDLNEYLIEKLVSAKAPIDSYGVGTELTTSRDDPALPGIYKLVEIMQDEQPVYKMKLSAGKKTLPGRKQIYRFYDHAGKIKDDLIALRDETTPPNRTPLMKQVINRGAATGSLPAVTEIQSYAKKQLQTLPSRFLGSTSKVNPPVRLSQRLARIAEEIR